MRVYTAYIIIACILSFGILPEISETVHSQIYKENWSSILLHPSWEHLLGTDAQGRDFFLRLFYGASLSLWMSFIINALGVIIGVIFGIILAILLKEAGLQVIESLLAIPFFVLGGIFSVIFGTSIFSLIISFGLLMALPYAYMAQSYILNTITQPFFLRSSSMGHSKFYIFFTHVIPIIKDRIAYQSWISIHSTIFALASMTFLGFGLQAPTPEWGSLIYAALPYIKTHPLLLFAPFTLFIILSWAIYHISNRSKISREFLYPHFLTIPYNRYYIVAQLESLNSFVKTSLNIQTKDLSALVLQEDYHFNFPKSYTIQQFLKDIFGNKQFEHQKNKIAQMLKELELPIDILQYYPGELSGGMLQRLSLLLGCLIQPEKLVLEAPFSSLNPELKVKALQFLTCHTSNTLVIINSYLDLPEQNRNFFHSISKLYQNRYFSYSQEETINLPVKKGQPSTEILISLDDVQTNYSVPSLRNKKIEIYKQEILGIIGYSGIGKTTLGKILVGELPIQQGVLCKNPLIRTDMIQQDPSQFNEELTVKNTLQEFALDEKISYQKLVSLLGKLHLPEKLLKEKMKSLSKSEQYQILFLRSWLYQPNLLVIDELLDHIPYEKYALVVEILDQWRTISSMSIVLISHKQEALFRIADRVLTLSDE